jgi:hypothetical protein
LEKLKVWFSYFKCNARFKCQLFSGVKEVDANVETKIVLVKCDESVDSAALLESLTKWSASSGKSVELVV